MSQQVPPFDWNSLRDASVNGRFKEFVMSQSRERWAFRCSSGRTLLHWACMGANAAAVAALIQSELVDANAQDKCGYTAAHCAAEYGEFEALEILCLAGADLRARSRCGSTPLELAIWNLPSDSRTACVLVANGVRLSTVSEDRRKYITYELEAFERGVLRCRMAVVAMLRVKQAGKLWWWDKFLLRELAYALWSTRYDEEWQN